VTADGHQTPADEGRIGRGIQRRQLPHRIHQHHLRCSAGRAALRRSATPRKAQAPAAQQVGNGFEPRRMPRRQQQQRIGPPGQQRRMRVEHRFLLARMSAAGRPRGPCAAPLPAQRAAPLDHACTHVHVEFDIADHMDLAPRRADGHEAPGIHGGLSRDGDIGAENSAHQAAEPPIARHRCRRQARARQDQRHAAPFAGVEQIGPQLGFHDDGAARAYAAQETRDRTRRVVGQEAHVGGVAEQAASARPARGSRGGQHQRILRIPRP